MGDLRSYLLVAVMAAGLTYCLTPVVRAVALRIGAVDRPGGRKMHAIATPTLGGLALFFGFIGGLGLSSLLFPELFVSSEAAGIAIGASLMVGIGIVDDLKGLSAPVKLAGQILAATTMTLAGVQVLFFWLPSVGPLDEGVISLAPELGIPITVLLVIVTVNAINLVDGLDGLAAGLVAIGAMAYFVYSYRTGATGLIAQDSPAPLLSALLFGICAGFLPHNFNPARIFMGDTGSLALGGTLAALALFTNTQLLLAVLGGLYVVETLSVILQVASFRLLQRRVFKMAPIHLHFELSEWPEFTVIVRFWILAGLAVAFGLGLFYAEFLAAGGTGG